MFRAIFELLMTIVVVYFIRAVLKILFQGFGGATNPNTRPPEPPIAAKQVPLSGELKKDPSCGTYISSATSIKETVGGETLHFCSKECRDKYVASLAR